MSIARIDTLRTSNGNTEIGALDGELRVMGLNHPIAIELNGKIYVPIIDQFGRTTHLIDSTSKDGHQTSISAFGEGEGISPWSYANKRLDPETGFIYFGSRYYFPSLGRWLTPDPAGFFWMLHILYMDLISFAKLKLDRAGLEISEEKMPKCAILFYVQ